MEIPFHVISIIIIRTAFFIQVTRIADYHLHSKYLLCFTHPLCCSVYIFRCICSTTFLLSFTFQFIHSIQYICRVSLINEISLYCPKFFFANVQNRMHVFIYLLKGYDLKKVSLKLKNWFLFLVERSLDLILLDGLCSLRTFQKFFFVFEFEQNLVMLNILASANFELMLLVRLLRFVSMNTKLFESKFL